MRDELLDFYKGIAIAIVVLGHTYQNIFSPGTFLNEAGFRFIGAMQMPFFVFLSGATASIWIGKYNSTMSVYELIKFCIGRVRSASFRLLVPFLSWTLIGFAINLRHNIDLEYFKMVFRDPMYSLWFLLCIFYCILTWSLMQSILAFFLKLSEGFEITNRNKEKVLGIWGQILFIFIFWELIKNYIPRIFGTWFLIEYFAYFILGVAFYAALKSDKRLLNKILQTLFSLRFGWIIYIGFLVLAPY